VSQPEFICEEKYREEKHRGRFLSSKQFDSGTFDPVSLIPTGCADSCGAMPVGYCALRLLPYDWYVDFEDGGR
jgi:hypothetical protein